MKVFICKGRHHEDAISIFPGELEAFMRPEVISAFYDSNWYSVLVTRGRAAMLHWFVPHPIGNTGYFDIEPWFGYAGPSLRNWDERFVRDAFALYRESCRERLIAAELIRFDPVRENHLPFGMLSDMHIVAGRPICYAPILDSEDAQLRVFAPACRRRIAIARKSMRVVRLDGFDDGWDRFVALYHESLRRVQAAPRWFFDQSVFLRIRSAKTFSLWATLAGPGLRMLASAMLVVTSSRVAHSLLIANGDLRVHKGANDLLIHEVIRASSRGPARWLCLGGGRTPSARDSLFAFKRKFAGDNIRPLMVGFVPHMPEVVARLNEVAQHTILDTTQLHGAAEVVQRFMPYRLVSAFSDTGTLS